MGSSGSRPSAPAACAAPTSTRSRRNIHNNFLVSFLRSMSCGTSSSWRTDFTAEGDEVNQDLSLESRSRPEDTSGCLYEQVNAAGRADSRWSTAPLQDSSSIEITRDSSEDTLNTQHSDDFTSFQVEASAFDAQTIATSSSISRGEFSGREAWRNNGRRLWDALTRASSHRRRFFPPFLLANEDNLGSTTADDAWGLCDGSSSEDIINFFNEVGSLSRRSSDVEGRRLRTRPQVWALQRSNQITEGTSVQSRCCASGRHPSGHCACEAFVMTEEWSTRASISRIVMLAEALFEVLDEIHRQSVTLSSSTSLPLISSPAPEAIVESFAVRIHKKCDGSVLGQCAECHICLIEYEEGDHIRVLPCCHEFHVSCVDKWLKEAHRVCPLCRHNVCEKTSRS